MATLHIVDGESSAGEVKRSLPRWDRHILVWRDALYDGPVPGGLPLAQLSRVRARHWNAKDEFRLRDRALAGFRAFEEVVLWFGPTMVCQLSLIHLLDWFGNQPKRRTRLSLIDSIYAGYFRPEQLAAFFKERRPVTLAALRAGRSAWLAFRSPHPRRLNAFLQSDSRALPELRPILERFVQEYPDSETGLSRIERKLLENLAHGAKASEAVANIIAGGETYGDSFYFDRLRCLLRGANQLICFDEPCHCSLDSHEFRRSRLALTEFGRKVLNR